MIPAIQRSTVCLIALLAAILPGPAPSRAQMAEPTGVFVAIGGGTEQPEITQAVIDLAGGKDRRVIVFPTASSDPLQAGLAYKHYFSQLGIAAVDSLPLPDRQTANDLMPVKDIARGDLLYFTGGDQNRLVNVLSNTAVHGSLQTAWQRRAVIAGTSAGAMVWGPEFIANGTSLGSMKYGFSRDPAGIPGLELRPGLNLWEKLVVDTHFSEQQRLGRLLLATAAIPGSSGMGVDEETAAKVTAEGIQVLGRGSATMIETDTVTAHNAQQAGPKVPFSIGRAKLHRVIAGDTYLRKVRAIPTAQPLEPGKAVAPQSPFVVLAGTDVPRQQPGPLGDFVRASGGNGARILLLAGDDATQGTQMWKSYLLRLGAAQVINFMGMELSEQGLGVALQHATGIFFLEDAHGSLLKSLLANQGRLGSYLHEYGKRVPLAAVGTAVRIVGERAIFGEFGTASYQSLPGLQLVPQIVADKSFWYGDSMERLIRMQLMGDRALAIGLMPDNAVTIAGAQATVWGENQVIFLDANEVTTFRLPPEGQRQPTSVSGLALSVVPPTGDYDLVRRQPRF